MHNYATNFCVASPRPIAKHADWLMRSWGADRVSEPAVHVGVTGRLDVGNGLIATRHSARLPADGRATTT
jgi:hypothetical protein